jgi:hypothetical protein
MNTDTQFQDGIIAKASPEAGGGWSITKTDGWSFFVPPESPVEPREGMSVRMYGRGIGARVRGLTLDGQVVFYRTEEEDRRYRDEQAYGKDAAEWLARWDAGQSVHSLEMGGIGPGYEQCIQITAAEVLRWLLANSAQIERWDDDKPALEKSVFPVVEPLGLSGAQWGAAVNLAWLLHRSGPIEALNRADSDRHIMVSRNFPSLAREEGSRTSADTREAQGVSPERLAQKGHPNE